MATLRCRACGSNVNTEMRRTRCTCGELFPLECVVCQKPLRPPLLVFPDERHLTEKFEPLCEDHYQRQCPDCGTWFRADQNPGYFRCPQCAAESARASQELTRQLESERAGGMGRETGSAPRVGNTTFAPEPSGVGGSGAGVVAAESKPAKVKGGGCMGLVATLSVLGTFAFSGLCYAVWQLAHAVRF